MALPATGLSGLQSISISRPFPSLVESIFFSLFICWLLMCPRRCGVVIARCRTRKDFVLRISARAHIQHNKGKPPTPRVHLVDHSSIRAASAGCRRCGRATQRTLIRTRERCVGIHDHCQQPHPIPSYPDTRNLPLVTLRTRYPTLPNPDAIRAVHLHIVPTIGRGRVCDGEQYMPELSHTEADGDR